MECWNVGIMEYWVSKGNCLLLLEFEPYLTHHSNIPLLHYSNIDWQELRFGKVDLV
jgi:hypothetical protein